MAKAEPLVTPTATGACVARAMPRAMNPAERSSVAVWAQKSSIWHTLCDMGAFLLPGQRTKSCTPCWRSTDRVSSMFLFELSMQYCFGWVGDEVL